MLSNRYIGAYTHIVKLSRRTTYLNEWQPELFDEVQDSMNANRSALITAG